MNIAITCLYLPSGSKIGVGYQVHALANALVGRGHTVTVFSPCEAAEDSLYDVRLVPPRRCLSTFGFAWDLRKIDFTGFDVLNAHGDDWFLWGTRLPRHVHTYHGSCLAEMLNARGGKAKLRMAALAACEMPTVLLADETVAVSENTRSYIRGIRHVIPCGVDLSSYRPAPEAEKAHRPMVLFVGTMHGRKRGTMLVQRFREAVLPHVPGAELWCVCDRPAGEPDGQGVRWMGRVSQQQLVQLYQQAWVFCLPSTYEGFGVPYIEAMACGTPVVATPNPGAVEVTGDGQYGEIAKDGQLASTLVQLLSDTPRRQVLAAAGLERSKAFGWDRVCQQYESLYACDTVPARQQP